MLQIKKRLVTHTVWFVWWNDTSAFFRVTPVATTSTEYNRLVRMRLAFGSEGDALARAEYLNDWMKEYHPLGESVPAGDHVVRFGVSEDEEVEA